MDSEQIESLHEKASEHYLQGNYEEAGQVWTRLLEVNPEDERALEGARLCEIMVQTTVGDGQGSAAEPPANLSAATDPGLPAAEEELPLPMGDGEEEAGSAADDELPLDLGDGEDAAEPGEEAPAADPELDSALSALDRALDETEPAAGTEEPAAAGEETGESGESLDFNLDLNLLDEMKEGEQAAHETPSAGDEDGVEAALLDEDPADADAEEAHALEPRASNPAERELERRINDLLHEAAAADDEGRSEEALEILSRLFILDDSHEGARVLEETIREKLGRSAGNTDDKLSEGVQLLEQGEFGQARTLFQEVLEEIPGHQEAQHFLEQCDEMAAMMEEEESAPAEEADGELPLGEFAAESTEDAVRDHGAIDLDTSESGEDALSIGDIPENIEPPAPILGEDDGTEAAPAVEEVAPAAAVKSGKGLNLKLVAVAVVVVLLAGGAYAWFGTDLLRGGGSGEAGDGTAAAGSGLDLLGTGDERTTEELLAEADRLSGAASEPEAVPDNADLVREALERAQQALDEGEYGQAVIAYNDAISIDPTNPAAHAGLSEAGRLYRMKRSQYEELDRAKQSFTSGDYTSALKVLYRLPSDLEPESVSRYKANAWYNLGLVELKGGDTGKAMENMDDVLRIAPGDPDAPRVKEIAERFHGTIKDLSYYAEVERLTFRALED